MSPRWFVYLLRCADGTYYAGATTDLERRLGEHQSGVGARYTRGRRPVRLAYFAGPWSRSGALRMEHRLKRLSHAGKQRLDYVCNGS